MAEGKRRQEWHRAAVVTCLIANTWRGKSNPLKVENFPYCRKSEMRKATVSEMRAFAANFFK